MADDEPIGATLERVRLLAEDGRELGPADWRGRPTLLVLLRWLG